MWQTLFARESIIQRVISLSEDHSGHSCARENREITGTKQRMLAFLQGTPPWRGARLLLRMCSAAAPGVRGALERLLAVQLVHSDRTSRGPEQECRTDYHLRAKNRIGHIPFRERGTRFH